MAGYTRQSTADIIANAVIKAAPVNAEYNAIRDVFAFATGHKHDGSSTEGAYIPLIADVDALNKVVIDTANNRIGFFVQVSTGTVEQLRIQDGAFVPVTDSDVDLGASGAEFKDLYIDGIGYIDTIAVHENATIAGTLGVTGLSTLASVDINGGNIDATQIGAASASTVIGTTVTATNFVGPIAGAVTGNVTGNTAGVHTGAVSGDVAGNVTAGSGSSSFNNVTINGSLDMNAGTSATITGLSNPVQGSDAATKTYVDSAIAATVAAAPAALDTLNELAAALGDDANYAATTTAALATKLPLAGGTLSGALAMGTSKITGLGTPTAGTDASTKAYVDTADALKVTKAGDTMSGVLAMGANKITGVADPTTAQDAATKAYIDTTFGSTSTAATSAGNAASSATAAANSASGASTSATNANNSATAAAASLDSFDDRYLGAKSSNPSVDNDGNSLIIGTLYFNSTANSMRVYNGSSWADAGSAVNGTSQRVVYTATANQTSFSVVYDAGFVDVYINGIKLKIVTDFAATSGTAIVLATGATVGDIVDIVSYGAFNVANTYPQAQADAKYALITAETGGYVSKTLSTSVSVDANTHYLTGSNFVINNSVVLTIPSSSIVEVAYYATQKQL